LLLLLGGAAFAADPARDGDGNPLPEGALLRLGTTRFRQPSYTTALALSPDGKTLAVGGAGDFLRLLDAGTGREVRQLKTPRPGQLANVARLEFAPDGKALAAGNLFGPIHVWDPTSGDLIAEISHGQGGFGAFSFSADAKRLAAASSGPDGNRAFVFETATGKQLAEVEVLHNQSVTVALSPNGKVLATAGQFSDGTPPDDQVKQHERNETLQLWDVAAGKELRRLRLEGGWRSALAFAPDGKSLAVALGADQVGVFDVSSGKGLRRFAGRRGLGASIVFSPDAKVLAATTYEGTVYAWDAASGKRLALFPAPRPQVRLAFAPGGRLLALTSDHQAIQVWDVLAEKELTPTGGHRADIAGLTFTADGKQLLSLSADGVVCGWDAATGREISRVTLRDEAGRWSGLYRFAGAWLAPDGQLALAAEPSSGLTLYELRRGRAVCSFPATSAWGKVPVAFSADGNLLAFRDVDLKGGGGPFVAGLVRVVDANTGQELHVLREHKGAVVGLAFAPDGKMLVSVGQVQPGNSSELYAWDTRTGKPLWHDGGLGLHSAAFSPDGRLLATASGYGVTLWSPGTGRRQRELTRASGGTMTFSPDGRLLSLSSHDGHTGRHQFVEVASGTLRQEFSGAGVGVGAAAFSPDGRRLATGGGDTTVLVWDLVGGAEPGKGKLTVAERESAWAALKDPDGRAALKAIRRLQAAPDEAVALLAGQVKPAETKSAPAEAIARWIAGLDAEHFDERQKAIKELEGLGRAAEQPLRKALAANPSAEARRRIEDLLDKMNDSGPSPDELRPLRAVEVLEGIGTPAARQGREALARGAPEAHLTQEAKASLRRLARRPAAGP
jgi:WD40 repeat protein